MYSNLILRYFSFFIVACIAAFLKGGHNDNRESALKGKGWSESRSFPAFLHTAGRTSSPALDEIHRTNRGLDRLSHLNLLQGWSKIRPSAVEIATKESVRRETPAIKWHYPSNFSQIGAPQSPHLPKTCGRTILAYQFQLVFEILSPVTIYSDSDCFLDCPLYRSCSSIPATAACAYLLSALGSRAGARSTTIRGCVRESEHLC